MGSANAIPGYSQVKSGVQLACGDVEGAKETQKDFFTQCPGVAQVTSVGYAIAGNTEKFKEINVECVKGSLNMADAIPIIGHAKGAIHYACGDKAGGNRAMNGATRTVSVIGGGAGGFFAGGPAGAFAGGALGGQAYDMTVTGISSYVNGEYRPQGPILQTIQACRQTAEEGKSNKMGGIICDCTFGVVMDGVAGKATGQQLGEMIKLKGKTTLRNIDVNDAGNTIREPVNLPTLKDIQTQAKGGFGKIKAMEYKGKTYVVKIIEKGKGGVREARIMHRIEPHADVMSFLTWQKQNGRIRIVMDQMPGSLNDLLGTEEE